MHLFVGLSSHRGGIERYAFDVLELFVSPTFPKDKTLRQMRQARPDLRFALRLHPEVALSGSTHPDIERAKSARDVLGASIIIVPTTPRFSPTARNKDALSALSDSLRSDECTVGWEARGVWSPQETQELCDERGMIPVRDLTRQEAPQGGLVYTRLLALGSGARIGQHAIETLASQLEHAETAYVIVEGQGAKATRGALREWFELED